MDENFRNLKHKALEFADICSPGTARLRNFYEIFMRFLRDFQNTKITTGNLVNHLVKISCFFYVAKSVRLKTTSR